ncbi:MAG: tetratricopeptide repeat protein [Polyangiaceae bacterium]
MLRRWAPWFALLLVVAAYVRTLGAPFVWDDRHLVLESPVVRTLQPLGSYFSSAFWTSPESGDVRTYYRPLVILSLALDHRVHGDNPAGFHLTNLFFHALNTLLAFALLRRFRVTPLVALFMTLVWALHPRLTEAVAWVAGRTDVLSSAWVLAALVIHRQGNAARNALASVCVLCGLLCKEVALVGVLALIALELLPRGKQERGRYALAALPVLSLAVYLAMRQHALSGAPESLTVYELGVGGRLKLAAAALGSYTRMLLVPWRPELQIGDALAPTQGMQVLGAMTALAIVAGLLRGSGQLKRSSSNVRPLVVVGLCLSLGGLGLVLHLIPISVGVVAADRFLYLPVLGLCLVCAPCLQVWLSTATSQVKSVLVLGLTLSFVVATWLRVGDWSSEIQLWSRAYRMTPKTILLPANELGNVYYRAGLFEQAGAIFRKAERDVTRDHLPSMNLASSLAQQGKYVEAQAILVPACSKIPELPVYCLDAGLGELHLLHFDNARVLFARAIERKPDYAAAKDALELVDKVEALTKSPDYSSADPQARLRSHFRVAMLAGRRTEALEVGEELLKDKTAPRAERREAAEYWARFGPPLDLTRMLGPEGPARDVADDAMLDAAALRIATAKELNDAWPALGIPVAAD